mgnify:CR=1 FL=1
MADSVNEAENENDCPSAQQLINFVANYHGLAVDEIATDLRSLDGEDAIRHLFTMAASLDSMVIGEAQILSQVKQAYDMANQGENTGPLTHSSFQAAMRVAKRVQTETNIHRKRVSIPSVAVADYASQFFERFDDKVILVIGAGEMLFLMVFDDVVNSNLYFSSGLANLKQALAANAPS